MPPAHASGQGHLTVDDWREHLPLKGSHLWFCLVLTFVLLTIGVPGCGEDESNPGNHPDDTPPVGLKESPQEGFLAPDFTLPDLAGKSHTLSKLRGQVVLVNIWATWCGPCKREIPSLVRLYQSRKDKGFEILAMSVDRISSSRVASFASNYRMSFPVLLNPRGDVAHKYWARSIPSTFLVDKKGVIRWKVVGTREWDDAQALARIDQLLAE
ncbi:MAG: TlpA family protein disulfide reductase [Candidatus Zixiibacteriota bacterium]|nr:MAG: TlpA family protein disulfide reductase [candidate division Zixibacteria bacterium]